MKPAPSSAASQPAQQIVDAPDQGRRRAALSLASAAMMGPLAACGQRTGSARLPFKLGASIYVGWVPWMFAAETGLLKEAGQTHGLDISLVRGSYVESIDQFMNGHIDAVVITNIDALAVLPGSGVEADTILIGSFSQGNDALLLRPGATAELRNEQIGLVENSVSHYLLHRYLESQAMAENAVKVVNVSDADIARTFSAPGSQLKAVATWKPIVNDLVDRVGAKSVFDSSRVPKEIADMLVVRRDVVKRHPQFARALLQTWFGVMSRLNDATSRNATLSALARLSESSIESYIGQLETTLLIDRPELALKQLRDPALRAVMERVENFIRGRGVITKPPAGPWSTVSSSSSAPLQFNDEFLAAI